MDFLTFLSKIIDSLSWPVLIFSIIFLLKERIEKILDTYNIKIKYKDLELNLEKTVDTLKDDLGIDPDKVSPIISGYERKEKLVRLSPRASILDSWFDVEQCINKLAINSDIQTTEMVGLLSKPKMKERPVEKLVEELAEKKVIYKSMIRMFKKQQSFVNKIRNIPDDFIREDIAMGFLEVSNEMISIFNDTANKTN